MKLELTRTKYDEFVRNWVNAYVEDMTVADLMSAVKENLHHNLESIWHIGGQGDVFGEMIEYGGEELLDKQLEPFNLKLEEL